MSSSASTSRPPAGVLLVTADDAVAHEVGAAAGTALRVVHRVRRSDQLRTDVDVILADPRLNDAPPATVRQRLLDTGRPVVLLVPSDEVERCAPALDPGFTVHVLTPDAPPVLLATVVRHAMRRDGSTAGARPADPGWSDRLAEVRHEMATPLTAIDGFLSALITHGERLSPERRQESLEAVHRNAQRLRRLVSQLNAITKSVTAFGDTAMQPLELRPVIERLVSDLGQVAQHVQVKIPADVWVSVDRDHLETIVENLLTNARKYGAPPIEVTARASDDGRVQLAVVDHGSGVPQAFVPQLFRRYARAEEAQARAEGTGIGLALSAELASSLGGQLRYEPTPGGGATFVLDLDPSERPAFPPLPGEPGGDRVIDVATAEALGDVEDGGPPRRRPVAGDLRIEREGLRYRTTVGLGLSGRGATQGQAVGAATAESSLRAIVRATLDAVSTFLDDEVRFDVDRVRLDGHEDDQHVTVTLTAVTSEGVERLVGAALTRDDLHRAAMHATLDALNRRIELLLA